LAAGENAAVTLVLSSDNPAENSGIEERLASIVAPLGFHVSVIWADSGVPEAGLCEALSAASRSPWTWMSLGAVIALVTMTGLKVLFWTLFWGTAAWFASKAFFFFPSRKKTAFLPNPSRR
jgi:hypothetical protein